VLSWQGSGTCAPFTGTISAVYSTSVITAYCIKYGCENETFRKTYATYSVQGLAGSYTDSSCGYADACSYTLKLQDAKGNVATATAIA
jgi:hypothetical protein